jgi:hypothetical protein
MTLASVFNLPIDSSEYICEYFDEKLMDPKNWTFPVTDKGVDGIKIIEKKFGLWKDVVKQNNIGRWLGTNAHKVTLIKEDIEQNGIDCTQPPVFIDIDTCDIITGGHRHDACSYLGIVGYMFVFVRCGNNWARKRFAKALNNERVFQCTLNSEEEVIEHIKYGISEGQLSCQQQIEDEIRLIANNSLSKTVQGRLVKEMISFVHNSGNTNNIKLERYTAHNMTTYRDFLARSVDPYVEEVLNNPNAMNYYINMQNFDARTNPIITTAAKVPLNSWINIQASVDSPSKIESLDVKREKVHSVFLQNLADSLDKVFMYKVVNNCYPWQHRNCKHAFLAQDHHLEDVTGGQFIRYQCK